MRKAPVVHQAPETLESDETPANVRVPIDAGAELSFAVIDMKGTYSLDTHKPGPNSPTVFRYSSSVRISNPAANKMACVEANPHAIAFADAIQNESQLLEVVPQRGPLAGSVLEEDSDLRFDHAEHAVEGIGDPADPGPFSRAPMCAPGWMMTKGTPRQFARCSSSSKAFNDLSYSAGSGDARLIR